MMKGAEKMMEQLSVINQSLQLCQSSSATCVRLFTETQVSLETCEEGGCCHNRDGLHTDQGNTASNYLLGSDTVVSAP